MLNLFQRLARRHAFYLLMSMVLLGGFEYLMCAIVASVNISGAFQELMKSVPPFMRTMVGEQFFAGLTTAGILAFGWNHPLAQALGTAVAIVLATRAIAGEIEGGVMELVLSQPLSRASYLVTHISFAIVSIAMLSLVGVGGTLLGQNYFNIEAFETGALLKLAFNFFILQVVWYSVTLAFSVLGREGGRVASAGFLIAVVSYFANVIGNLWPNGAFLLLYSLHTYYSPRAILVENTLAAKSIFVLFSVFIVCVGFTVWRFQRRDIP